MSVCLSLSLTQLSLIPYKKYSPTNGILYLAGFDVGCGLKGHFSLSISEQRQSIWDYGSPAK